MADNPNVSSKPVEAKPNHYREKTYAPDNPPKNIQEAEANLPENKTREKTAEGISDATEKIKRQLRQMSP